MEECTGDTTQCTIRDPEMAVPSTGKEENIHFAVSRRIRRQKERTSSRKKQEQVTIEFLITVLLFGLFVIQYMRI